MIIGITGLIGSGKSLVGSYINQIYNISMIDCDDISRVLQNNSDYVNMIESAIGRSFRNRDNRFDRKKLSRFLISRPGFISAINNIMHPPIIREVEKLVLMKKSENRHLVVLVPLLFECGIQRLFDKIIYVYTDEKIRKQRLMKKRNFKNLKDIEFFDKQQIPADKKFLMCDHVILNNNEAGNHMVSIVEDLFLKVF